MYLLVMTSPARGGGDWPELEIAGRWVGDRVVILGDYTEDSDLPPELDGAKLYERLYNKGNNITAEVAEALGEVWNFTVKGTGWATRVANKTESV